MVKAESLKGVYISHRLQEAPRGPLQQDGVHRHVRPEEDQAGEGFKNGLPGPGGKQP